MSLCEYLLINNQLSPLCAVFHLILSVRRIMYQGRFVKRLVRRLIRAFNRGGVAVKEVVIYTDGACVGNPGPGGYGAVIVFNQHKKELSGGEAQTTNNRMEMMGAIAALEALKEPCKVKLYSDSRYVVDGIGKGWAKKWRANGWMRNKKDPALNVDLWQRMLAVLEKHDATFLWVKGHAGHLENERCDALARMAIPRGA
jgi:ribonuclease HI